jgi:uncharacterized protein (DUF2132 family)
MTENTDKQQKDPLHGITLEQMLIALEARLGWEEMARRIDIRCFKNNPSIKSSLAFLRRTPWARTRVEELFRG